MARTPKSLSIQTISSTNLITLAYIVPASTVTTATLVITNTSTSILEIDIYINNTVSDFLFEKIKIPAGFGKNKRVLAFTDEKLNQGFQIKLQATTNDEFNVFLSGVEVSS